MASWDITKLSSDVEFDTANGQYNKALKINDTHVLNVWTGSGTDGFARVFTYNQNTGAVTGVGTAFEFDTSEGTDMSMAQVDANHFIVFYKGTNGFNSVGNALVLEVNLSTYAVTAAGAKLEFDSAYNQYNSCAKIDDTHFINFWSGQSGATPVASAQIFTVNTSTWAITAEGSPLTFYSSAASYITCAIFDTNKAIAFWAGDGSDGFVRTYSINTSTWAITAWGSQVEHDTANGTWNSCYQVDTNRFVNAWTGNGSYGFVRVFEVNLSNGNVSGLSTALEFDTADGTHQSVIPTDSNHFLLAWTGTGAGGFMSMMEINLSTWAITNVGANLEYDTADGTYPSSVYMGEGLVMHFWTGSGADGFVRMFLIQQPPVVVLNSPADEAEITDTTPELVFTGTDPEGDDITYQVQVDTVSTFNSQAGEITHVSSVQSNNQTFSVDGTGGNLLVVCVATRANPNSPQPRDVTGVTYNSIALTKAADFDDSSGGTDRMNVEIWYLVNPSSGSNNVVITLQGTVQTHIAGAILLNGVDPSNPLDAVGSGAASTTDTVSSSITTVEAGSWVVDSTMTDSSSAVATPGANQAQRWNTLNVNRIGLASTKATTTAGSTSMSWTATVDTNGPWASVSASFRPLPLTLINATSGTDSGFSGSPDNADPFTSGQAVTYTVQSELAPDTYYWRVIGIDPSGTSEYGTWSETRSFTVESSGEEVAEVDPVSAAFSVVNTTATYDQVETASVAPVSTTISIPNVTATYQSMQTAVVASVTALFSIVATTATFISLWTAGVAPVTANLSTVDPTATYEQINTATVEPVVSSFSVVDPTATYAQVEAADVDPVTSTMSVVDPTAAYQAVINAVVAPVTGTLSVVETTATHSQNATASVDPVSGVLSVVDTTATYDEVDSAVVEPIASAFSVVEPAASYVQVETASVDPVVSTLSVVGVTATYIQIETASVTPITATFGLADVTATHILIATAEVTPITGNYSLTDTTSVASFIYSADVSPLVLHFSVTSITPTISSPETGQIYVSVVNNRMQFSIVNNLLNANIVPVGSELEISNNEINTSVENISTRVSVRKL